MEDVKNPPSEEAVKSDSIKVVFRKRQKKNKKRKKATETIGPVSQLIAKVPNGNRNGGLSEVTVILLVLIISGMVLRYWN